MNPLFTDAQILLREVIGEVAVLRPGQWDAIEAIASKKQHVLAVQLTGAKMAGHWMGKVFSGHFSFKPLVERSSRSTLT